MSSPDPFTAFKSAFEEQRLKIEGLYERISKLEEMNGEFVSFVKQNNLIASNESSNRRIRDESSSRVTCERVHFSTCSLVNNANLTDGSSHSNLDEVISDTSLISNSKTYTELAEPLTIALSELVQQQASGLGKALENLGFVPSVRHRLIEEIRCSMSSILSSQLGRSCSTGRSACGSEVLCKPLRSPPRSFENDFVNAPEVRSLVGTSSERSTSSSLSVPRASSSTSHSRCTFTNTAQDIPLPSTHANNCTASPSKQTEVQERRRRELARLNKRIIKNPSPHVISKTSCCGDPQNTQLFHRPMNSNFMESPPKTLGPTYVPSIASGGDEVVNRTEAHKSPSVPVSSTPTTIFLCPCGNLRTCPLSEVKQYRLATDPVVQRGFTLVAAIFRGRFIRQLLATNKVYDLIRTVKDTAKLALSIHVELQSSTSTDSGHVTNTDQSAPQNPPTNEELVLQNRLLAQLRNALGQLHEIFFQWPLSNQLDLLRWSRNSSQQRTNRMNAQRSREDVRPSSSPVSESSTNHRPSQDSRRLWQPSRTPPVEEKFRSKGNHQSGVLRQLQPHQIDRFGPEILARQTVSGTKAKPKVPDRKPVSIGLRRQSTTAYRIGTPTRRAHGNASLPTTAPGSARYGIPASQQTKENITLSCTATPTRSYIPVPITPACSRPGISATKQRSICETCSTSRFSNSFEHQNKPDFQTVLSKSSTLFAQSIAVFGVSDTSAQTPIGEVSSPRVMQGSMGCFFCRSESVQAESGLPLYTVTNQRQNCRTQPLNSNVPSTEHSQGPTSTQLNSNCLVSEQTFRPRRPISGHLGRQKQQSSRQMESNIQYPVRKRIVASRTTPQPTTDHFKIPETEQHAFLVPEEHCKNQLSPQFSSSHLPAVVSHSLRATWSIAHSDESEG